MPLVHHPASMSTTAIVGLGSWLAILKSSIEQEGVFPLKLHPSSSIYLNKRYSRCQLPQSSHRHQTKRVSLHPQRISKICEKAAVGIEERELDSLH